MKDMSWSQALMLLSLVASLIMIGVGTSAGIHRRRHNRRIGLPRPTAESTRTWH